MVEELRDGDEGKDISALAGYMRDHFPPFYTLQPNLATREKQLALWRTLLLSSSQSSSSAFVINDIHSHSLFVSEKLSRRLSKEGVQAVADSLIALHLAEWMDGSSKTSLRVMVTPPSVIAAKLFLWASSGSVISSGSNNIFTFFELHSSQDFIDAPSFALDPLLLLRALQSLESEGKCALYPADSTDEIGVKFIL